MKSNSKDTGGEFGGPVGRPPFARLAKSTLSVSAGWVDRFAREQNDNSEFAIAVSRFRVDAPGYVWLLPALFGQDEVSRGVEEPFGIVHLNAMSALGKALKRTKSSAVC